MMLCAVPTIAIEEKRGLVTAVTVFVETAHEEGHSECAKARKQERRKEETKKRRKEERNKHAKNVFSDTVIQFFPYLYPITLLRRVLR